MKNHQNSYNESREKGFFSLSFFFSILREKFGLHQVDFNDPSRPRTPKASSQFLKKIVTNNGFIEGK